MLWSGCHKPFPRLPVLGRSLKCWTKSNLPTGIICTIPGTSVHTVAVYFQQNDIWGGLESAVSAGFGIGAIAAGIDTARILTDLEWGFERDR